LRSGERIKMISRNNQGIRFLFFASVAFLLSVFASSTFAVTVDGVRLWRAPDNTRIVFDLSGPVSYKIFPLPNNRIVIDISNGAFNTSVNHDLLKNTPVKNIRTGIRNKKDLRVVLDLHEEVRTEHFLLAKLDGKNDRLVIDLFDMDVTAAPDVVIEPPKTAGRRDIIIAVDAGHGGEDPGAIGPKRIYEKKVVLAISKELVRIINKRPGYHAELTRTGDYYLPLKERRELARKRRADLFVSIHADAFKNPSASGASVYALSMRGAKATSDTARHLAQKENSADLIGGVRIGNLKNRDALLTDVLVNMLMTETLRSSLEVADQILKSLGSVAKLHKSQVEQANFVVLQSADMPSVLVETGYISNPGEARKLNTSKYRKRVATKIFSGIETYFYNRPPHGSYIAWQKSGGGGPAAEHVIARGDTLSGIAQRYNISVAELKLYNGLSSAVIRIGQRLKIPST